MIVTFKRTVHLIEEFVVDIGDQDPNDVRSQCAMDDGDGYWEIVTTKAGATPNHEFNELEGLVPIESV